MDLDDVDAKLIVSIILCIVFLAASYGLVVTWLSDGYEWWQIVIGVCLLWILYVVIEWIMYNWDTYFSWP